MKRLHEKYKNDPELVFLTVSLSGFYNVQEMQALVKTNNIQYTVLLDLKGETSTSYAAPGIPITFFIDREGTVRERMLGVGTLSTFEQALAIIIEK